MTKAKRVSTRRKKKSPKGGSSKQEAIEKALNDVWLDEGETIEPSDRLLDYCILVYGESGIGKTSTVAQIEGSYVIQLDPKRKGLSLRQANVPNRTIEQLRKEKPPFTPWELLDSIIAKCAEDKTVQTAVIDNFGMIYQAAFNHVCYQKMIADPNEVNDYGQTWRAIADLMAQSLDQLFEAGKGIVLIAHSKEREIEDVTGTYDRIQPAVMSNPLEWLKACTDFVLYFGYSEHGDRVIHVRGDKHIWLKACADEDSHHFKAPDGTPLKRFAAGTSPNQAWKNIQAAWEGKMNEYAPDEKPRRSKKRTK